MFTPDRTVAVLPKGAGALIVLSGGMDSVPRCSYEYRADIALAVTFSYGANHNARETECASWHCRNLGIEHIVIPLGFIGEYFNSSLLSGADAVPSGHYTDVNMRSTVVPFRNGIMLAVAAGLAESRNLGVVMLANHAGDHAIYPDCRPAFVEAMGAAIAAGTYADITLFCPYTGLTKARDMSPRCGDGSGLPAHLLMLPRRRTPLRHMRHMHRAPRSSGFRRPQSSRLRLTVPPTNSPSTDHSPHHIHHHYEKI